MGAPVGRGEIGISGEPLVISRIRPSPSILATWDTSRAQVR